MKYKITIISSNDGGIYSEIVSMDYPPAFTQYYTLSNGFYGPVVKLELLMDATEMNTIDNTENL